MIKTQKEISEIKAKYPLIKWVLFQNSVYDLTNFVHPGGDFLIEQCIGRDVTRFLIGAYSLESTKFQPYNHSENAYSLL